VNILAVSKALQLGSTGFFLFFVCLFNLGVLEQPGVMLEQTSKNHSAVLRNISVA